MSGGGGSRAEEDGTAPEQQPAATIAHVALMISLAVDAHAIWILLCIPLY